MNMGTYSFKIGAVHCTVLSEGQSEVTYDLEKLSQRYPQAAEAELISALERYDTAQSMNILLIRTGNTTIVADTGMGSQAQPRYGFLLDNLAAVGGAPADVDMVFITHFHGDHINGLVGEDGTPTFPQARLVTSRTEWDTWMATDFNGKAMLEGLEDRFELVEGGDEIAPEVFVLPLPGHTLGQCGLRIESGGEGFTHLVDLLHHPAQFEYPHWHIAFDTDGEAAAATRKEMLHRAAEAGEWVLFYHLPDLGLGHVRRAGDAYQWEAGRP